MSKVVFSHELRSDILPSQVENLVCITSTIHYTDRKLSYSLIRSVYFPKERFGQLIRTIQSVREKIEGCFVVVLETSNLSREEKVFLESISDILVLFIDNKEAQKLSNGLYKGAAECALIRFFLKETRPTFKMLHKISGRYYLDNYYNLKRLNQRKYNFTGSSENLSTRYYTVPPEETNIFLRYLQLVVFFAKFGRGIEWWFHVFLPRKKINKVTPIGVSGNVAIDGFPIQE